MIRIWIIAISVMLFLSGCDKNSTPIDEPDASRESARRYIAMTIEEEEAQRTAHQAAAGAAVKDEAAGAGVIEGEAPMSDAAGGDKGERRIEGLIFRVPSNWRETPKSELSSMRAAEFQIPSSEDNERGVEVVVFYFGPGQGGSADANIQRWIGQLERDGGTEPKIETMRTNELTLTSVYVEGTLKASTMGMGPREPQPHSALYGVVIEGGKHGSLFVRATGPRTSMQAAMPDLMALSKSIRMEH